MKTRLFILSISCILLGTSVPTLSQLAWYEQQSPVAADLIAVSFTDTLHGWALGHNGEIIKTTDGGKNWELATTISNLRATKIFFINDTLGWATGFSTSGLYGRVLHTINAGDTWIGGTDSLSIFFNDVYFYDKNRGWIVGYDTIADTTNYIMHTSDGGFTWERQMEDMFLAGAMMNVNFRDSVNGNIVGSGGFFLHTFSGGEGPLDWWLDTYNWQIAMTDVYNVGEDYGCMIGSGGIAYFTTDNWNSKKLDYELPVKDTLRAISGTDNLRFWAVGDSGAIVYFVYSPIMHLLNITDQSYNTDSKLTDVKAVTDSNIWAVGTNGIILHYGLKTPDDSLISTHINFKPLIYIYPNPTSDQINISTDYNRNCNAYLINSEGKQVLSSEITLPCSLELEMFPAGIYILKLYSNAFSEHRIIIIN